MKHEEILELGHKRFAKAQDWESYCRGNAIEDRKFYQADEFNGYQWSSANLQERGSANKPCLTINRTQVLVDSIINDSRQNQPSIKIRAVNNAASVDAAEVYEGVVRHIEQISSAQECYDTAMWHQIVAGWGYWRVVTDYVDTDSFVQDIKIVRIGDPLSVYMDPDIQTQSGEDSKWCFIFKSQNIDDFNKEYPKYKDIPSIWMADDHSESWVGTDEIRVAEYYVKITTPDTLYMMEDGSVLHGVDLDPDARKNIARLAKQTREVEVPQIKWYLLAGDKIVEERDIFGTYIPVVRLIGKETVTDGQLDRCGHVRGIRSAQVVYNAMNSAGLEAVSLQSKVPWVLDAESVGNYTHLWEQAHTTNFAYLLYNSYSEDGNRQLPPPTRSQPPVYPNAYHQAMQIALQDMTEASGQEPASLGRPGQERSARSIQERVRQSDRATYHYAYRLAEAIRLTGRILLEWIPLCYDSDRVVTILAQDGTYKAVQVDPNAEQAHAQTADGIYSPEEIQSVWNPKVGKFDVLADSSANFASRRADAFNAISQILQQNESLTPIIGDLLMEVSDFPNAQKLQQRMLNMVPKQALGEGPSKEEQEMSGHLKQQDDIMGKLALENQDLKNKMLFDQQGLLLKQYQAETERYAVMAKSDPEGTMPLTREMISQLLDEALNPLVHAHAIENAMLQKALGEFHPQADQSAQGGAPPMNLPPEAAPMPPPGADPAGAPA